MAGLAYQLALGGLDYIKDDHGLANQSFSPFEARVRACAAAVRKAAALTGRPARYVPNLYGHFGQIERQLGIARSEGLDTAMIAPAIAGVPALRAISRAHPDFAFIAHPAMTGAARVSPYLYAKLFRLFGADAVIFPNPEAGSVIPWSAAEKSRLPCAALGWAARQPAGAGGRNELATCTRIARLLWTRCDAFDRRRAIIRASRGLVKETAAFMRAVAGYRYG